MYRNCIRLGSLSFNLSFDESFDRVLVLTCPKAEQFGASPLQAGLGLSPKPLLCFLELFWGFRVLAGFTAFPDCLELPEHF